MILLGWESCTYYDFKLNKIEESILSVIDYQ